MASLTMPFKTYQSVDPSHSHDSEPDDVDYHSHETPPISNTALDVSDFSVPSKGSLRVVPSRAHLKTIEGKLKPFKAHPKRRQKFVDFDSSRRATTPALARSVPTILSSPFPLKRFNPSPPLLYSIPRRPNPPDKTCMRVMEGHTRTVTSVAFSPDGTRIVSGSRDNTLRLWDAVSGAHLFTLSGHSDDVLSVSFSPDGTRIVSGSDDQTLRLWDAVSGAHLFTLSGHSDDVPSVSFSPDGTRIVSGSDDQTLRLWDAVSGAHLFTLSGHSDMVTSVSFSPDGTRIVSGSYDKTLRLWDAIRGAHLSTLSGHSDWVTSVAFSPDGTRVVSGSWDMTLRLWDAVSGAHLFTLSGHSSAVNSVSFSPDGTRIVSGSYDQTLRLWDAIRGAHLSTLSGHSDWVTSVAFSPDGTRVVSGSYDDTLRLWDAASSSHHIPLSRQASISSPQPETPKALRGPTIPATLLEWQRSQTILPALDEKEELFDDSIIDGDASISRISKLVVHHCGTVYKLEVHYVLNNQTIVVREHGNPAIPRSELVDETVSLDDSEQLVEVQGVASPGLIWQLKFISENKENQKRHEYGPYGEHVDLGLWPGMYRFRAMGNIIAFGGSTDSAMLTGLSFITDGSPLKMELGFVGDDGEDSGDDDDRSDERYVARGEAGEGERGAADMARDRSEDSAGGDASGKKHVTEVGHHQNRP